MRFLAVITMLILAITLAQPVAAQNFKPDWDAGWKAMMKNDWATALKHLRPLAKVPPREARVARGQREARLAGGSR